MGQLPKRCLFCEKNITGIYVKELGSYLFRKCYCTGTGEYEITEEAYERLNARPHQQKREQYPLVSGYIREMCERQEQVKLVTDDLSFILESPGIPRTLEAKKNKCLVYLYRHSDRPEDPVVLDPIQSAYNLTYSPNLQEFIYILEELKASKLISRMGSTLRLTPKAGRKPRD